VNPGKIAIDIEGLVRVARREEPLVGIVANPVSARDIRRVVAKASSLQITDRANIVLCVLACLRACGIRDVLMMAENGGIGRHVDRGLERARNLGETQFPNVRYLPMRVCGTADDTHRATQDMVRAGVAAIVVLGGDGTHRAVAAHCGAVPIAGISTGTNNAFPEHGEPTIVGLAAGLAITGRIPADVAFHHNKRIDVSIGDGAVRDVALVDVALVTESYVGARALWRTENFRELYVTFADPAVIGMSAIAGLLEPRGAVGERRPYGPHGPAGAEPYRLAGADRPRAGHIGRDQGLATLVERRADRARHPLRNDRARWRARTVVRGAGQRDPDAEGPCFSDRERERHHALRCSRRAPA
jgi:ATP-NAD kinase N-terminal domain